MESTKQTARLAGLFYLLLGIANIFGLLCAPLVLRDASAIANQIVASELLFRVNTVSDLVSHVFAICLVVLLYQLLRPVNQRHALLMMILLLVSVPISFVLTLNDVAAHLLFKDARFLSAFTKPQLDVLAILFLKLHVHGVFAVEIFWGLWLVPFGLLVLKSRCIPRILGVLLIVAGVAYVTHSFVSLLLPDFQHIVYERATMLARAAGELPVMLWLLIKGAEFNHSVGQG